MLWTKAGQFSIFIFIKTKWMQATYEASDQLDVKSKILISTQ